MGVLTSPIKDFLHLFFPHYCAGCGTDVLEDTQQLCYQCYSALPVTQFLQQPNNPVEKSFYGRMQVRNAGAAYYFTKDSLFQNLLFQLKYKGNKSLGVYLGRLLGNELKKSARFNDVDVLVPLPLNPRKEKIRGYNQATMICKGIEEVWQKPYYDKIAYRKVFTESQTHKGRISRWQNMEGVFGIDDGNKLQGKHILLIDDVITTGATLEACGTEILKIPQTTLSIATLAYTI